MADPKYYISYTHPATGTNEILTFDATLSSNRRLVNKIPKNILSTGEEVADHVVNLGDVVSLSGIISDLKSSDPANPLTTDQFISNIELLRDSKTFFDIISGDITAVQNSVENCLFETLTITQNQTHGVAGGRVKSYVISLTAKQVRVAELGITGEIRVPGKEIKDAAVEKTLKASATVQTIPFTGQTVFRNGQPVMIVPGA